MMEEERKGEKKKREALERRGRQMNETIVLESLTKLSYNIL